MHRITPHFALLFACCFTFSAVSLQLSAQNAAYSIVAGFTQLPYKFDQPTVYDKTAAFFPWEGRQPRTHYQAGIDYSHVLSGHWHLKTGLRFAYARATRELDWQWPAENTNGQYTPIYQNERLRLQNLFLDVPLALRYEFSDRKFAPFAEAGFALDAYLVSGVEERIENQVDEKWSRMRDIRPFSLAAQLAVGVQYRLAARQVLFVQPQLRYQLAGVDKVSKNPAPGWGVEAGWRVLLKP